jgi:glycosyltransferase involved in cell wall biosynthesis
MIRRKIKILYVLDHFFSGGTQRNIKDFIELVDRDRFDLTIYSLFGGNAYFHDSDPNQNRKICLIDHKFSLLRYVYSFLYITYKLTKFISAGKFDIVHIRLYAAFPVGVIASKLGGVKHIIYTIEASRKQLPFYCFPIFKLFSRYVEYFLSYYQREYLEAGLPRAKFRNYEGGINLASVNGANYDARRIRAKHNLEASSPIIISAGRLYPDKGHQYGILALQYLKSVYPQVKLVILGEGLFEPQLRRLVSERGLDEYVYFAGFRNNIGEFHHIADICLKTAINEPTNLATLLGMAYGNPVVAFDTGFDVEILKHGETGCLVPNKDPRALAKNIIDVLENPALRAKLSEAGRNLVYRDYDIRKAFRRSEAFYQKVLDG